MCVCLVSAFSHTVCDNVLCLCMTCFWPCVRFSDRNHNNRGSRGRWVWYRSGQIFLREREAFNLSYLLCLLHLCAAPCYDPGFIITCNWTGINLLHYFSEMYQYRTFQFVLLLPCVWMYECMPLCLLSFEWFSEWNWESVEQNSTLAFCESLLYVLVSFRLCNPIIQHIPVLLSVNVFACVCVLVELAAPLISDSHR